MVGLLCSLLGAGFLVFVGSYAEEYDPTLPGEWFIVAGGGGLVAGLIALYGLAVRARRPSFVGAALQALVAALLIVWPAASGEESDASTFYLALFAVIVLDGLVLLWARTRTLSPSAGDDLGRREA